MWCTLQPQQIPPDHPAPRQREACALCFRPRYTVIILIIIPALFQRDPCARSRAQYERNIVLVAPREFIIPAAAQLVPRKPPNQYSSFSGIHMWKVKM